jgi:CDP-glucose 4,6-dehydratase
VFANVYNKRRVFVTGHTGFKGSWLCQWLLKLGAEVHGYALDPQEHETLYDSLDLSNQLTTDTRGDIRDLAKLRSAIEQNQPEIILHLAAQPLVRLSFEIPVDTFQINVLGTVNVLESIRTLDLPCSCVIVTTDKCYENREWLHSYREEDAMGGYDPYSASKGCAELVTSAYRRSYFHDLSKQRIASARAGNVIGGGDWAKDRIVPDIFRAIFAGQPVPVRNKHATRPWQHVLEPLSGYLWLAACLHERNLSAFPLESLTSGFNFGPSLSSNRTVAQVVEAVLNHVEGTWEDRSDPNAPHEASKLNLAIDKAFHMLEWKPKWSFEQTIRQTATWYTANQNGTNATDLTKSQIEFYENCNAN